MMLLVLVAAAGLLGGVLCGGRVSNLAHVRLRTWWLVLAALAGQGFVAFVPGATRPVVIVAVGVCLVAWCFANLGGASMLWGMAPLAVGLVVNLVVISANAGMPVSANALQAAGIDRNLDVSRGLLYKHVAMATHGQLAFLGDHLSIRWFRTVVSPGDVLMLVGIALVLAAATRPSRLPLGRVGSHVRSDAPRLGSPDIVDASASARGAAST